MFYLCYCMGNEDTGRRTAMRNNIKALREMKHKTQEEVADDLGITLARYRSWEQGKRSPSGAMGIKLAQYFGVSTDTVFGSDYAEELPLTSDEERILDLYRTLNHDGKTIAKSVLDALVKSGDYI